MRIQAGGKRTGHHTNQQELINHLSPLPPRELAWLSSLVIFSSREPIFVSPNSDQAIQLLLMTSLLFTEVGRREELIKFQRNGNRDVWVPGQTQEVPAAQW